MSDGALFYADKIILSATYSRLVEESEQWMLKRSADVRRSRFGSPF